MPDPALAPTEAFALAALEDWVRITFGIKFTADQRGLCSRACRLFGGRGALSRQGRCAAAFAPFQLSMNFGST